jgi:hypothetical protein
LRNRLNEVFQPCQHLRNISFCRNIFTLKKTELSIEKLQQCPRSLVIHLDDGVDQTEQVTRLLAIAADSSFASLASLASLGPLARPSRRACVGRHGSHGHGTIRPARAQFV